MSVRFKNERVVRAPNECTPQNSQTKKVTSNAQIKNHPEDFVLAGGADRLQFNLLCGDWTKKLAWHEPERGRENGIFRLVSSSRDRSANRCSGTNNRELQTGRRIETEWKSLPVGRGPPDLYGLRRKTFWELRCDFFEASEDGRRVIAQT